MVDFRKKRFLENIFYSKITIGTLSVLLLFALSAVFGVYEKFGDAKQNKDIVKEEYNKLEEQVNILDIEVAFLKTERGVEKTIREEFGFAKEGERAIVIVGEEVSSDSSFPQKESFLSALWEGLKELF